MQLRATLFFGMILIAQVSFALNDPTRPATPGSGSNSDFVVKMIKFYQGQAVANVSDKVVKVGDEINGAKVIAIEHDNVLFRAADGSLFSVSVNSYVVKKSMGESHESEK